MVELQVPPAPGRAPLSDAARAATVADLRAKLARLGGLGRPGAAPAAPRRAPAVSRTPRQPGFEAEQTPAGTAWVRRVDVDLRPLLDAAGVEETAGAEELLALCGGVTRPPAVSPGPAAVLDIESLGLRGSGVMAFLVGVGLQRSSTLEVHQLLLADPGEEAALLGALLARLDGCATLVTYNGRTFDVPTLRSRLIVNRLADHALDAPAHCDLLGPVRRLFRDRLGPCTLRQAEVELLAMERVDDVPGFEAPGRYRAWLWGAGAAVLEGVVRHNELDLCATAVLGARLVAHVAGRMVEPVHPADRYRLALHLERQGRGAASATVGAAPDAARAARLLRETVAARAAPWDRRAAHRLAVRLRRAGGAGEAEALTIWRTLWRSEPDDLRGARALAVALERAGRLDEALEVSLCSLRLCAGFPDWRRAMLRGAPAGGWTVDWERRAERLHRRLARAATPRRRSA